MSNPRFCLVLSMSLQWSSHAGAALVKRWLRIGLSAMVTGTAAERAGCPDADEVRSVDRSHAHPRGTDGSQTRPWRELDPNSQFHARYGFGSETFF